MYKYNRLSLLSSEARIQVPWIKVTFAGSNSTEYTFGIFTSTTKKKYQTENGYYYKQVYGVQYPNYIQSLEVTKINGQVNQYSLSIVYPVTQQDDPNFFEKVFSSVSKTRKIIFTYGDAAVPSFVYKNEEAVITTISQSFNFSSSAISYTVEAVSSASLTTSASLSFGAKHRKPSDVIKEVFWQYKLYETFTGMNASNLNNLIAGGDTEVDIEAKTNISALDYISYLVSCMYPRSNSSIINPKSIYILTIHDASSYDSLYTYSTTLGGDVRGTDAEGSNFNVSGPYFKVSEVEYASEQSDAYEIDVGYNTRTIVTQFSIENNENYALYYDYQQELTNNQEYVRRLNNDGTWEDVYAPTLSSKNQEYLTKAEDRTWWTKITQFPVNASITVQGLLRPAQLLTYVRLNVIFPGGNKHISSGLYIITKQIDTIDSSGYKTKLSMTKVGGDNLTS